MLTSYISHFVKGKRTVLFWPLMALFVGCGGVQKMTLGILVGPMVTDAAPEIEREANWETFRGAILGNLKFLEGLLSLSPDNKDLLSAALQANGAYAFGVWETLWLKEKWRVPSKGHYRELALQHYAKAIHWGFSYLKLKGITYFELIRAQRSDQLSQLLESKLEGKRDRDVVFFLAQSMGGHAHLNRTSPMMVAQLPLVKGLFDWICGLKPEIRYGSCSMFYGAWEAGRPKMMGGDLAKGRQHFLEGIKKYPENYLIRVAYLKFYVIPVQDKNAYQEQKDFLRQAFKSWERRFLWAPTESRDSFYEDNRNLYNAIAKKQFEIIIRNEKSLFEGA